MDKYKFAEFIGWLSLRFERTFGITEMETIDRMITEGMPKPTASLTSPDRLNDLLSCLNQPGKFIEAIKVYRELTGVGLKEGKEAIESYRNTRHGRRAHRSIDI